MKPHARRVSFTMTLTALGMICGFLHADPATACGVPLTVQDIQSGIMPSEANLPCTSNGDGSSGSSGSSPQHSGPSPQQVRWQRANGLNERANAARDRGDSATAVALYQQALDLTKANGDQHNSAIIQKNLNLALKEYGAIRNDNRVNDARSRFNNQNVYNQPNPFAAPASAPAQNQGKGNSNENCFWDEHGRPCHPGGAASAANPATNSPDSLRERLKRSLESDDGARSDQAAPERNEINTANRTAPPDQKPPDAETPKTPQNSGADDPLKNYLDSGNRSGSLNNGTLTNRDPKFEMSRSETRHEVDRMQGVVQVPRGVDGQQVYGPPVPDEGQARR